MEHLHDVWLASRPEEPLDPDQLICDPHHHLWDRPLDRYLLGDLQEDTGSGHNVDRTVFIECRSGYRTEGPVGMRPVGETEFVAAAAEESDRTDGPPIAGIVGYVDLRLPEVDDVLAAHVEAGGGRFRGIRHTAAHDPSPSFPEGHSKPPPDLMADQSFRAGVAALGRAGLSYDAWIYHPQLPQLVDLARAVPEVPIILDHLGGPVGVGPYHGRRKEILEWWRGPMTELAGCPNVNLKLGGIGMPIFGIDWHHRAEPPSSEELAAAWGEPITWCIEQFGVDRCMFESNFPVDKTSCSYTVLWNTFQRIAADASPSDKAALFHDTATRVYRLAPQ
jgi:predicted TIM-barrel fold metal-dependent hydrolase